LLLGNRLRELRQGSRIGSQERLAELAGVHRTYIGRLERGESGVTVETLATVAAALNTSLREFLMPFSRPIRIRTPRRKET
jgi:transcriptional regulator with XRE-family HTH domain